MYSLISEVRQQQPVDDENFIGDRKYFLHHAGPLEVSSGVEAVSQALISDLSTNSCLMRDPIPG